MKIEHLAIWVKDLEEMKNFYASYFDMRSNRKYTNEKKQFSSYFLSFPDSDARLELMHRPDIAGSVKNECFGIAHFAISVGCKAKVNLLTAQLKLDGYRIQGNPRTTGDGCFESIVLDPEGNHVEITE